MRRVAASLSLRPSRPLLDPFLPFSREAWILLTALSDSITSCTLFELFAYVYSERVFQRSLDSHQTAGRPPGRACCGCRRSASSHPQTRSMAVFLPRLSSRTPDAKPLPLAPTGGCRCGSMIRLPARLFGTLRLCSLPLTTASHGFSRFRSNLFQNLSTKNLIFGPIRAFMNCS